MLRQDGFRKTRTHACLKVNFNVLTLSAVEVAMCSFLYKLLRHQRGGFKPCTDADDMLSKAGDAGISMWKLRPQKNMQGTPVLSIACP